MMKAFLRRLLPPVLFLLLLVSITPDLYAEKTAITILHVNDTHSHLDVFGPKDRFLNGTVGGIAKAAAIIGSVRAQDENVILLHAGDLFTGDLFFNTYLGIPELQLMRSLGFDAMAVGNHEFDLTPAGLLSVLSTAFDDGQGAFPLLSANLDMTGYPALESYIRPSTIIERAGVRIGIFGMTVPDNPMTMCDPVKVLGDVGRIACDTASELRADGADVVICLSHLGSLYDRQIAAGVPGIDVIVGGHDHRLFNQPLSVTNPEGKQTLIVQAGEFYRYVGRITIFIDAGEVSMGSYRLMPVGLGVTPAPEVKATVEYLKAGIVEKYGEVYRTPVGFSKDDLDKHYDPKTPVRDTGLGNLITDGFRSAAGTDIAITANGLISEKIYAGCIVPADVFRAVPYGFDPESGLGLKLVKLQLTGKSILDGLEATLASVHLTDDFLLQCSGMRYRYDSKQPPGKRLASRSVRVHGKQIDPTAIYTVAVNEAIAYLLPKMGVTPISVEPIHDFEYTVVRDHISDLGTVRYRAKGRILDVASRHN